MKKKKIGILTSGGDCPGLNATIRGAVKACFELFGEENIEIIGILDGYYGLINGITKELKAAELSGLLTRGGTILGSKRQSFKMLSEIGEDNVDKFKQMKETYKKLGLDCLLTLGGNGTHKSSNMLTKEGLNVIGLPKTIDNDIFGTDVTFGFQTAVDIATEVLDRLHTTATSHGRILLCEIMGNKAGWLTLTAGIAGGADIILIPEIPYDIKKVIEAVKERNAAGKKFSIIAVAEGAYDTSEANLKRKDRQAKRLETGEVTATNRIANEIIKATGYDTRVCVPGHMLRGGSPNSYDRVLATNFGVMAAELIKEENYGRMVALRGKKITSIEFEKTAGITKFVKPKSQLVATAKDIGISFGD
ncbi:MAG: 6-phosphofructokinase [Ruminococcus sp.]|jgi:6-phosphofructokinase 1|nr:6-phosphofructokinase [Ruminococcus sp.]